MQSRKQSEKRVEELESELATLRETNTALLNHVAEISTTQHRTMMQETKAQQIADAESSLRKKLEHASALVIAQEKIVANSAAKIKSLESQLREKTLEIFGALENEQIAARKIDDLHRQLSDFGTRFASLETQSSEQQTQVASLGEALKAANEKVNENYRKMAQLADDSWEKDLQIEALNEALRDAQNKLAERTRPASVDMSEFESLKVEINSLRAQLTEAKENLRSVRATHTAELEEAKRANGNLGAKIQKQDVEISRLKAQADTYERQLAAGKMEVEAATRGFQIRENELNSKTQAEIALLKGQMTLAESRLADAKSKRDSEREALTRKAQEREAELTARHQLELGRAVNECKLLEARLNDTKNELETVRIAHNTGRDEAARNLAERERAFRETEAALRAEVLKHQSERAVIATRLEVTETLTQALRKEKEQAEAEASKLRANVDSLQAALYSRQSDLQTAKEEAISKICESERAFRVEIKDVETRLDAANRRLGDAQARIQSLEESLKIGTEAMRDLAFERDSLQKSLAKNESRAQAELTRAADWSAQLALRENQLRVFAGNVNKDKTELQNIGKSLVQEIRMVSAAHPLKDYLSATEYELSKLEVQLKATPTLSSDRSRLEEYLVKLVEQREFLKTVLANSQKQFERRAVVLERMMASPSFAPVPPLTAPQPVAPSVDAATATTSAPTSASTSVPQPRWEKPLADLT